MGNDRTLLPRPHVGTIGHAALEVGAWLVGLSTATIAFAIVGVHGFGGVMDTSQFADLTTDQRGGTFNSSIATPALLAFFAVSAIGILIPPQRLNRVSSSVRSQLLTLFSAATACAAVVLVFIHTYWLTLLVGLLLGLVVGVLAAHAPEIHTKPWRTGGIAVGAFTLVTYYFQLEYGATAGASALRWLLFAGAIILILAALAVLVFPLASDRNIEELHTFPHTLALKKSRGHMDIAFPWACYALFVVLGALFVLPLPSVVDGGFGQASVGLMLATVLVGWAVGYESGPTFAPGMTRPRVTAFTLLAAGILTMTAGFIDELSGKAMFMGLTAFVVGVGVRAQKYEFSRRVGLVIGMLLALVISGMGMTFSVPLSTVTTWTMSSSAVAFGVIGLIATVAGILAIFIFSPLGVRGMTVDLVNAFTPRHPETGPTPAVEPVPQATPEPTPATSSAHLTVPAPATAAHGLFIAIEGGDGAGKSTQISRLASYLTQRGFDPVITTREPGGTPAGQQIRHVLLDGDGVSPKSEALLYAADRAHHIATLITPTLSRGGAVITDRYIDSSLAYQAGGRDLSEADILALSRWATEGLVPQLTIVLDIDPVTAASRMDLRGATNHMDAQNMDFKTRVREGFLRLAAAAPERYAVIAANRPIAEVAAEIQRAVASLLPDSIPDTFTPEAPRGSFEGVPTELMPPEDVRDDAGEAPTTVMRSRTAERDAEEAPTTVVRSSATGRDAEEAPTTVVRSNASGNTAETRVIRDPGTRTPSQSYRDKLRQQATVEREARERLRNAKKR